MFLVWGVCAGLVVQRPSWRWFFLMGLMGLGIFYVFGGFGVRSLCWVGGATACFCKGFWCFVKNRFFGVFNVFGCFDIYVLGWKFYFVFVYIKCFKKWFIILGFFGWSGCLIWWKCKNFDSNFGSVWKLGKIFEKVLVWGVYAGLMVQRRGGRSAFGFFFGISLNVLMSKNFFLGWKIFWVGNFLWKILGSASDFWKFFGKRWRVEEFFVISLKV